jgi:hypothetical protein
VRSPVEGGDDARLTEVGGSTGPPAEPLDEASDAIERWREDLDRDSASEQTAVGLVRVGDPPAADQFRELTEQSRTAVGPTTE